MPTRQKEREKRRATARWTDDQDSSHPSGRRSTSRRAGMIRVAEQSVAQRRVGAHGIVGANLGRSHAFIPNTAPQRPLRSWRCSPFASPGTTLRRATSGVSCSVCNNPGLGYRIVRYKSRNGHKMPAKEPSAYSDAVPGSITELTNWLKSRKMRPSGEARHDAVASCSGGQARSVPITRLHYRLL